MKNYDLLPPYIQKLIDAKESREVAKSMNKAEKPVNDVLDVFYTGESSVRDDVECGELNSWMSNA